VRAALNLHFRQFSHAAGEKAASAKPNCGCSQGAAQSTGGGRTLTARFTGRQWCEMAHHQFQAGRPGNCQTEIALVFYLTHSSTDLFHRAMTAPNKH